MLHVKPTKNGLAMKKKDKFKIYLSFSRECDVLSKTQFADGLNNYHENIEASAFWGGTYDRERLFKDIDLVVCVSWDIKGIDANYAYASRGVYEEAKYAKKHDIPVFLLVNAKTTKPSDVFMDYVHVKRIKEEIPWQTESWDGSYGKFFLSKSTYILGDELWAILDDRGLLNKTMDAYHHISLSKPMLAAAKSLNLI